DEVGQGIGQVAVGGDGRDVARVPALLRRRVAAQEAAAGLGQAQQAGDLGGSVDVGCLHIPAFRDEAEVDQHHAAVLATQRAQQPVAGACLAEGLGAGVQSGQPAAANGYASVLVV